ncbi:hypothetical protein KEM52_002069, partial [Ascosphaera acerosa]
LSPISEKTIIDSDIRKLCSGCLLAPDGGEVVRTPVQRLDRPPAPPAPIVEFVLLLPLNLLPLAGPVLFLVLTGYRAGPLHHHRYFVLRGMDRAARRAWRRRRRVRYTLFGTMALALQLVPVLSMFFLLSTAAGSAIWAADMEKRRRMENELAGRPSVPPHRDAEVSPHRDSESPPA